MKYYDNSRVKTYKECPREYLFRHVFHWTREYTSMPLVFGSCWHESMDVVWGLASSKKSDKEIRDLAMRAFMEKWDSDEYDLMTFDEMESDPQLIVLKYGIRHPFTAMEMLGHYIEERRPWIKMRDVIAIEQPFAVPLPNLKGSYYIGRKDKMIRELNGDVLIIEHKTSTEYAKAGGFKPLFIDRFDPNSQVDGYSYDGHFTSGNKFKGVWIDAALVHKTVHDKFKFIAINKSSINSELFITEVQSWIDRINKDKDVMKEGLELIATDADKARDLLMSTFPRNTESCLNYFSRCTYFDLCRTEALPHTMIEPPPDYIVNKWEPFDLLKIEKLGLEPEEE